MSSEALKMCYLACFSFKAVLYEQIISLLIVTNPQRYHLPCNPDLWRIFSVFQLNVLAVLVASFSLHGAVSAKATVHNLPNTKLQTDTFSR